MKKTAFILFVIACLSSCNYFDSGTWIDDPRSWEKIFYEEIPDEVEVVHSYFWKSSHYTYEIITYFEIKASKEFIDNYIIKKFQLRELKPSDKEKIQYLDDGLELDWFLPKDIDHYTVWVSDKFDFLLFMDPDTKHFYFTMSQI